VRSVGGDGHPLARRGAASPAVSASFCTPFSGIDFFSGDDAFFRCLPKTVVPRLVRRAVGGGGSAAKLAEALSLSFFKGDDYFEVDCDIVGSPRQSGVWDCWASAAGRGVFEPVQF